MSDRSIRDAIQQIVGVHLKGSATSIDATVLSIQDDRTCTCQCVGGDSNVTLTGVRLMASVDDGFLIMPEIDSTVCVIVADFSEPYISQYSGIDKIIFRGGDLGGLVEVIKLTQKLNNLENKFNDLAAKYNAHVHPVIAVGSPSGPTATQETGTLTPTKREEIENKNITHG